MWYAAVRSFPLVTLLLVPAVPAALFAQGSDLAPGQVGARAELAPDWEIALARSAAPAAVSDSATVYRFTGGRYVVAVEGTNGVACYVGRSWPESLEPHCHDREGAESVMRIDMGRVELLHAGVWPDSVDRAVSAGLRSGRFRAPRRPALSWMMSGAQRLIGDDGRAAGRWRPHLMIYYPNLDAAELGLSGPPDVRHAILVDGGRPTANLTIVVSEFIEPRGNARPR